MITTEKILSRSLGSRVRIKSSKYTRIRDLVGLEGFIKELGDTMAAYTIELYESRDHLKEVYLSLGEFEVIG